MNFDTDLYYPNYIVAISSSASDVESLAFDALIRREAVEKIIDDVSLARIWSKSPQDLLTSILDDPGTSYHISGIIRYFKYDLSRLHQQFYEECHRLFVNEKGRQASRHKCRELNQLLLHAVTLLPRSLAISIIRDQVQSKWVTRRRTALKAMRKLGPPTLDDAPVLRDSLRKFRDPETVVALAKVEHGLEGFDCCFLVQSCKARYYDDNLYMHTLIVERMFRDRQTSADHLIQQHPWPFLRAIGRIRDPSLSSQLIQIIEEAPLEILGLAISVARRMKCIPAIDLIEQRCKLMSTHGETN